ncbi:M1 family metallopeptidase [Candidatus Roizmanbacteria bacterium]|nr:M1 family metallopeptidase [Candidatus Roizmanbacteria bacterium]
MTLKPLNYNLTFTPDFKKFTFEGKEVLTFEIKDNHHEIQLDSADITVQTCKLINDDKNVVKSFRIDASKETLHIEFKKPLSHGKYQLEITYHGILNDQLKGFYRSRYTDKGKDEYVLTTQFEPTEAHRAFPCIDNPSYKATFDVSFIIPKDYTGISNMLPTEEKDLSSSTKLVRFATTPVMSTYLLYFGIGKWEIIEKRSKNLLIRGITTPGKAKYTQFALEVTEKCLNYFIEYFDYPYILPKVDLLAIPDFGSGAMENWGAITFREILLLYYPGKTSKAIRERITEVICHELAHQWFGNLVTMKWFDDIWLNESFATYMAFKALHHIFPEWDNWQNYVTDTVFEGMALDSLHSTHPIHVHDVKIKDIDELFDEISYDKGGSVLRMIEGYMGGDNFRKAIRNYIRMFQYQNTIAKDLWDRFEDVSGDLTAEMIEKFIIQPGFPLINVFTQDDTLRLEQQRFLFLGTDKNLTTWDIPVVMQFKDHSHYKFILADKQTEVKKLDGTLVTLNNNYGGFYIINADEMLYKEMEKNFSVNSPQDKVGMIHDLYYLVLADKKPLDRFLDFIEYHSLNENNPYVMQYVTGKLLRIFKLTKNKKAEEMLNRLSNQIIKKIGLKPESEEKLSVSTARNTAIASLIFLEDEKITFYPIVTASANPNAKEVTYRWLVDNWEKILEKLGLVTVLYMRKTLKFIIPECAIGKEQEINLFLQEHTIAGLDKTYAQVLEELEVNVKFVRRYRQSKVG